MSSKREVTYLAVDVRSGFFRPAARFFGLLMQSASAQSQWTTSAGVSGGMGGTLSWTVTYTPTYCSYPPGYSVGSYNFSNFVYSFSFASPNWPSESVTVNIPLAGNAGWIDDPYGPQPYCPASGPQPSGATVLTDSGQFIRAQFTSTGTSAGNVTIENFSIGAVMPKYVVQSVIYAPPGGGACSGGSNQSFVDYTSTTAVGTSTSISNSFTNGTNYSVSTGLFGISQTLSAGYTQQVDSSSSIAINQTASVSDKYPGTYPACSTVGMNHDNDIILVWLNPALLCGAESAWSVRPDLFGNNAVQCFQYDPHMAPGDPDSNLPTPQADILPVAVGWLDGDYPMDPGLASILQSHGITSADYPALLAHDPYASCKDSTSCVQLIGIDQTRFTESSTPPVPFLPLNGTETQGLTYSGTTTQEQGSSFTESMSVTLSGSASFLTPFTASLSIQNSLTWTSKWSSTMTSMVGHSAEASITQPTTSNYPGPRQFAVFQDNSFGSFMFYPTQ